MRMILLKNPSGQKVTVKKTISDVSPGNSNRVQTKLARKNSRQFSCIFTHLQKRGVLQQNPNYGLTPATAKDSAHRSSQIGRDVGRFIEKHPGCVHRADVNRSPRIAQTKLPPVDVTIFEQEIASYGNIPCRSMTGGLIG